MYLLKLLFKIKKTNKMKYQFKTIDLGNINGHLDAKKLQADRWKIINFAFNIVIFKKLLKNNKN